jgi:hypothetical protein
MSPVQNPTLSTVRSHSQNAACSAVYVPFPNDPQAYHYYCFQIHD